MAWSTRRRSKMNISGRMRFFLLIAVVVMIAVIAYSVSARTFRLRSIFSRGQNDKYVFKHDKNIRKSKDMPVGNLNFISKVDNPDSDLDLDQGVEEEEEELLERNDNQQTKLKLANDKNRANEKLSSKDLSGLQRLVHLDLKGAAPRVEYYEKAFPLYKKLGATGLLIEYEDMFPYRENIHALAAGNSYSTSDIKRIVSMATQNDLTIIPLVQTFGHLEFMLKNNQFEKLREVKNMPQNLNPGVPESMTTVQAMIDQVIAQHPNIKHIHIGCDEVYNLGMSSQSQALMKKRSLNKDGLFLYHVSAVASYIKSKHPDVTPIIWDDMMRRIPADAIKSSGIAKMVEPMVWKYTHDLEQTLNAGLWQKYSKLFKNVWTASSFKGATGPGQYYTNVYYHLENHRQWLKIINKYQGSMVNFRGIALTGWQRFDHFGTLCELLPVGTPSLAANLICLVQNKPCQPEMVLEAYTLLECKNETLEQQKPKLSYEEIKISKCLKLPGHAVFEGAQKLKYLMDYYRRAKELEQAFFNEYLIKHGLISPGRLGSYFHGERYSKFMIQMKELAKFMESKKKKVPTATLR